MTARDFLDLVGRYPLVVAGCVLLPPLLALLFGLLHGRGRGGEPPWRFLYAILVYAVTIPGMGAAVVTPPPTSSSSRTRAFWTRTSSSTSVRSSRWPSRSS